MKARSAAALASAALILTLTASARPAAAEEETLRVCLNENIPPYSFHEGKEAGGFDLAVAEAVAKRLGRVLAVQWFETGIDSDSSLTLQANALLSDGRCQLVGGYPLFRVALGRPTVETARLPGFEGAKPDDRRRRVALGELVPTKPYHFAPLTVILSGSVARQIDFKPCRSCGLAARRQPIDALRRDFDALWRGQIRQPGHPFRPRAQRVVPSHGKR